MTTATTLMLSTSKGKLFFRPEEIVRLEATSNYTRIYLTDKRKLLTAKILKEYATLLSPFGFVRTHRTHLVNRLHIACILPGGQSIIMRDDSTAEISRRMKREVMKALGNAA